MSRCILSLGDVTSTFAWPCTKIYSRKTTDRDFGNLSVETKTFFGAGLIWLGHCHTSFVGRAVKILYSCTPLAVAKEFITPARAAQYKISKQASFTTIPKLVFNQIFITHTHTQGHAHTGSHPLLEAWHAFENFWLEPCFPSSLYNFLYKYPHSRLLVFSSSLYNDEQISQITVSSY